jgi:hypothetical protein
MVMERRSFSKSYQACCRSEPSSNSLRRGMFEMLPSETSQSAVGRRTPTSAQTLCKSFCRHESQQSD